MTAPKSKSCHVASCGKTFEEGDKHLEDGVWISGYRHEGYWYCSEAHLRKGTRHAGFLTFLAGVFGIAGIAASIGVLGGILAVLWPSRFSGEPLWQFIVCTLIASFSFWFISQLDKLR